MPANIMRHDRWTADDWQETFYVHPATLALAANVKETMKKSGADVFVTDGFRSPAEQAYIYASGRTRPGPILTRLSFGMHNLGFAFDMAFSVGDDVVYEPTQALIPELSIPINYYGHCIRMFHGVWGGDWETPDDGHGQVITVHNQLQAVNFFHLENGDIHKTWLRCEKAGLVPQP